MLKVLDFSAEWCGPCKMLSPIIDELALEYPDVEIQKIDVDTEKNLTIEYKVRSIPTIIFIKDDEIMHKHVGSANKLQIVELIESLK
jgi:thioredoxin 1